MKYLTLQLFDYECFPLVLLRRCYMGCPITYACEEWG